MCQRTLPQKHHFTSAKLLKFQETFLDLLFPLRKGRQKNFPPTAPLYFGKAFEIPKDFSRKVLCVGVWGRRPNIQYTQKARQCRAFLFFRYVLELRSKPCFKGIFVKIPKNFRNEISGILNFFVFR